jgi:predicted ATPase/DNA-binding CsgD family transcriptional regulator
MKRNNGILLPVQITPFVGREAEIAALGDLLQQEGVRLVTIVGAGGMGKSRLAIEVANRQSETFADGVYFVPLAPLRSARQIVHVIIDTLGLSLSPGDDPNAELMRYLGDKQLLLLLDNFEHLVPGAPLLNEILGAAPEVTLLTTSREKLNLTSETVYGLAGLAYSDWETPEEAVSSSAGQLFIQSAQRSRPEFEINKENVRSVAAICRLVEGMPLGILLATAWVDVLSTAEIAAEIQDNTDFLETEMQDVPARQRSFRAVFETSWERLTQAERALFEQLSVFRGGFTYQAAREVGGASPRDLAGLVNKSFLQRDPDSGRYSVHELLRQYAGERLSQTPDREVAVRDRHCTYFSKFMDLSYNDFYGAKSKETVKAIEADIDNVWSAWDWAIKNTRIRDLHRSMDGLGFLATMTSWIQVCEKAFREAVTALRVVEPSPERDMALGFGLSHLLKITSCAGRRQLARELVEEGVAMLRPLNAGYELARSIQSMGENASMMGDMKGAQTLFLEVAPLFEETGQYELQADAYRMVGVCAENLADYTGSQRWYEKALSLAGKIENYWTTAYTLKDLGDLKLILGEYVEAGQYARESLTVSRAHEFKPLMVHALRVLGQVAEAAGELETAEGFLQECLATAREWGRRQGTNNILIRLAHLLVTQRKHQSAKMLYEEAQEGIVKDHWPKRFLLMGKGRLAYHLGRHVEAQRLHEESLALCRNQGDRFNISGNHHALGRIAMALGDSMAARSHFQAALQAGIAIGAPPLMLDSIAGAAEWFAQERDPGQAAQLAKLVVDHPASRAETKARAADLLRQLKGEKPPEEIAALAEQSTEIDLAAVATDLLARLAAPDETVNAGDAEPTSQPLIDRLSERELEVLRLVAMGKSNREIARELVLALGTVKSHLHHILQKLDARSRTEAVARARELGLF